MREIRSARGCMPKHIGIVGCSAEGAALCYRTICLEAEPLMGKHAHPEVTMHTISLAEYMKYLQADYNWKAIGDLMLRSAEALQRAGADFLICPDNTIHQAMAHVLPRSPLPWLHIAEEVGKEASLSGIFDPRIDRNKIPGGKPGLSREVERAGNRLPVSQLPSSVTGLIRCIVFDELVRGIQSLGFGCSMFSR